MNQKSSNRRSLRLGFVGAGKISIHHAREWFGQECMEIVAVSDVNAAARSQLVEEMTRIGYPAPLSFASMADMIAATVQDLDAVYICTPHCHHGAQTLSAIEAGLDVLLEKPMVTTLEEAEQIMAAQEARGSTVVVAYQGAMSALVQDTLQKKRDNVFGELIAISGLIWEDWAERYDGHWKQVPEIAGGGFMFDTGAHMLNTISLLADAEVSRIAAIADRRGRQVDIVSSVNAQLTSGVQVVLLAVGNAPVACASEITLFFSEAIVRIDAWGAWRQIETASGIGEKETVNVRKGMLETFMDIRDGNRPNGSPAAQGLRFAKLWDAIKECWAGDMHRITNERSDP